ncbi:hypothetical protein [Methylobacterium sp. Leaf108]|uniref:hypothetical protein n=1 Tax=Methylobacterium sp. Leaf108 TaxID=1736256 RepID=UPI0006FB568C|nr:hypothetical protein [Methylobacterium sp. Leaf108]KQP58787.1 hypothetical protein ASF39_17435 [Methylobacterium sp. Leaf108]
MATMIISGDTLRATSIEGDPALVERIRALDADDPIVLRVEGHAIRFRKARDGGTIDGIEPDPDFADVWRGLQARRGAMVTVEPERRPTDAYLVSLSEGLTEWNSPEDAAAYDGL